MTSETNPDRERIAPCPFCGDKTILTDDYGYLHGASKWTIWCDECGATQHDRCWSTEADAIAAWNRRALPPGGAEAFTTDGEWLKRKLAVSDVEPQAGGNTMTDLVESLCAMQHAAPPLPAPVAVAEVNEYSAQALIQWLHAKYKRHGEIEDERTALMLEDYTSLRDEYRDLCEKYFALKSAAPEEFAMVPREPTAEMIRAAKQAGIFDPRVASATYLVMLNAAPTPTGKSDK